MRIPLIIIGAWLLLNTVVSLFRIARKDFSEKDGVWVFAFIFSYLCIWGVLGWAYFRLCSVS